MQLSVCDRHLYGRPRQPGIVINEKHQWKAPILSLPLVKA
jgi:hypothetical protein